MGIVGGIPGRQDPALCLASSHPCDEKPILQAILARSGKSALAICKLLEAAKAVASGLDGFRGGVDLVDFPCQLDRLGAVESR